MTGAYLYIELCLVYILEHVSGTCIRNMYPEHISGTPSVYNASRYKDRDRGYAHGHQPLIWLCAHTVHYTMCNPSWG